MFKVGLHRFDSKHVHISIFPIYYITVQIRDSYSCVRNEHGGGGAWGTILIQLRGIDPHAEY